MALAAMLSKALNLKEWIVRCFFSFTCLIVMPSLRGTKQSLHMQITNHMHFRRTRPHAQKKHLGSRMSCAEIASFAMTCILFVY